MNGIKKSLYKSKIHSLTICHIKIVIKNVLPEYS